jgi:cAMP-dependent protein kinase regulator
LFASSQGEIALLTDRPRQATVTAVEPSKVLCLSQKKFRRVMGPMSDVLKRNISVYTRHVSGSVL